MTFFNKKEEVLDVQLTDEGRRQLAVGRIKPAYYAFFDDNILYDIAYASGDEEQNISQDRILDETLYPKLNSRFVGTAKRTTSNYTKDNKKTTQPLYKDIFLRDSPFMTMLGSYNSTTQQAPYFEISVLTENVNSLVTGTAPTPVLFANVTVAEGTKEKVISGGTKETNITQLNITSSYRYYYDTVTETTYYHEDPLLFEIVERNAQFSNFTDDFEIEVFEVIESNSTISQPKYFILEDNAPGTSQDFIDRQIKMQQLEKGYQNLISENLDILLDEQAEPLFPKELLIKKAPNAKAKVICEEQK